jgi:hypothetical protein
MDSAMFVDIKASISVLVIGVYPDYRHHRSNPSGYFHETLQIHLPWPSAVVALVLANQTAGFRQASSLESFCQLSFGCSQMNV